MAFNRDLIGRLRANQVYKQGTLAAKTYGANTPSRESMNTALEDFKKSKESGTCIVSTAKDQHLERFRQLLDEDTDLSGNHLEFDKLTPDRRPDGESDDTLQEDADAWEPRLRESRSKWMQRLRQDHPR